MAREFAQDGVSANAGEPRLPFEHGIAGARETPVGHQQSPAKADSRDPDTVATFLRDRQDGDVLRRLDAGITALSDPFALSGRECPDLKFLERESGLVEDGLHPIGIDQAERLCCNQAQFARTAQLEEAAGRNQLFQ